MGVKRIDRKLMYEGSILKVYKDKMSFPNGNTEDWDYIHHDGAAAVVPVLPDGRILLVSQYRNAVDKELLEIPAGKLDDKKEDFALCARRELEEETGYACEELEWLLTIRTMIAFTNEKVKIYLAKGLYPTKRNLDENEFVTVQAFTLDEIKKKIFKGELQDCKTIAAILAYESRCFNI